HAPVGLVERAQLPRRAERVHTAIGPCRRGAGAIPAHRLAELGVPGTGPQLEPRGNIVGGNDLPGPALLDGERPAPRDRERSIAAAGGLLPERLEAAGRPVGADGALGILAVTARSAEVGPVRIR